MTIRDNPTMVVEVMSFSDINTKIENYQDSLVVLYFSGFVSTKESRRSKELIIQLSQELRNKVLFLHCPYEHEEIRDFYEVIGLPWFVLFRNMEKIDSLEGGTLEEITFFIKSNI